MARATTEERAESPAAVDRVRDSLLIDISDVVKDYVTDAGTFRALDRVSLQVAPGEFIAVVGKSGSGKSTLLNMITAIDRPTAGDVWVAGTNLGRLPERQTASWRGTTIGVVFQFFQLLPTLTVLENVMLPMDFAHRGSTRARRDRALELLAEVDMVDQANKLPLSTSGGQQQRAAIARALANDPPILVADEPTGNLDTATATAVFQLFERLAAANKTVLMVTHDAELASRTHRTVHMVDGRIVDGQPRDAGAAATAGTLPAAGADSTAALHSAHPTATAHPSDATPRLSESLRDG